MPIDDIPQSLQESILAALLFDDAYGSVIAGQVTAAMFDEGVSGYRQIAERALSYRRKFRRAPGRAHLDDLFGKLLTSSGGRPSRLRRTVFDLGDLAEEINGEYLVSRTGEYVRQKRYYAALLEANSRYEQGGDQMADDIEQIFTSALRARTTVMESGTFLNDQKRAFKFFERRTSGISMGIKVLDDLHVNLVPGEMTLYVAPKGSGKSWKCVNVGLNAILQGKRVVHISLEMPEWEVTARYYQRNFAAARWPDQKYKKSYLDFNRFGGMTGYRTRRVVPNWHFASSNAQRELREKMRPWGVRFGNLVVKHFPSGSLTVAALESYLDYLEIESKFVPHVIIVDYPDLMKIDARNLRIETGRLFVDLRGVGDRRRAHMFCPTQGGRDTIGARFTDSKDVTEDISKVFTADQTITYQQTAGEYEVGLARLHVAHSRVTRGAAFIIITQAYTTGQYALDSALMPSDYWGMLNGEDTERPRNNDDADNRKTRWKGSNSRRSRRDDD